ncbi:EamA/RhaT family transporter, partial [Francisella tularensis subsp. holarctica]|nr:EamA/RhaT family transporter [Francisella tularensis subsp. holarctica]
KAILSLFIVKIFLGVSFPLLKISLAFISPGLFVAIRLSLSFFLFLPLILRDKFYNTLFLIKVGAIFGSIVGVIFYFQTLG